MATTDCCGISEKRGVVRRAIEDGLYDFRTLCRAPCTVCRRPDCRRGGEARAPTGERQGKGKGHLLGKDRGREKGIELESVPKTQALARVGRLPAILIVFLFCFGPLLCASLRGRSRGLVLAPSVGCPVRK